MWITSGWGLFSLCGPRSKFERFQGIRTEKADDPTASMARSGRPAEIARISAELRHVASSDRAHVVERRDAAAARTEQLRSPVVRIQLLVVARQGASRSRLR